MSLLWLFGIFLAFYLLGAIYRFVEKKLQNKATFLFQKAHPNLLENIDERIKRITSIVTDNSCFFHTIKFPSYGKCFCCERGDLILKRNRDSSLYFIGCTSFTQAPRYYRRARYSLKSCNFTFSI